VQEFLAYNSVHMLRAKLSRLCTFDLSSALDVPRSNHLVAQGHVQEKSRAPGGVQVPQANPSMIELHNVNQEQSREKGTSNTRDKMTENIIKLKNNFMNRIVHRARQKNSHKMILHRRRQAAQEGSDQLRITREAGPAGAWLLQALILDTMATYIEKWSHRCTKDKTYGSAL
jgi:hypothetical protein